MLIAKTGTLKYRFFMLFPAFTGVHIESARVGNDCATYVSISWQPKIYLRSLFRN